MAERTTSSFDPARKIYTVVPSDSTDLSPAPKALWVNVACTVVVMGEDGVSDTIVMPGPGPLPFAPKRVMTTSTAPAGAIKALVG